MVRKIKETNSIIDLINVDATQNTELYYGKFNENFKDVESQVCILYKVKDVGNANGRLAFVELDGCNVLVERDSSKFYILPKFVIPYIIQGESIIEFAHKDFIDRMGIPKSRDGYSYFSKVCGLEHNYIDKNFNIRFRITDAIADIFENDVDDASVLIKVIISITLISTLVVIIFTLFNSIKSMM